MIHVNFNSAPRACVQLVLFSIAAIIVSQSLLVGFVAAVVSVYLAGKVGPSVNSFTVGRYHVEFVRPEDR